MYHRPRFKNYNLGKAIEDLYVLPTGTMVDFSDMKTRMKNMFMADWLSEKDNKTTAYIFEKKVNTKKPAFSAIISSGELDLVVGEEYDLRNDQSGARICRAKLYEVFSADEINDENWGTLGYRSMSLMVFK